MRRAIRFGFVATLLALLGCGSEGGSPGATAPGGSASSGGEVMSSAPVHASGSSRVAAKVGPAGGSLELSSGPRVEIPAGALSSPQDFVLEEAPKSTAFYNQEHERPVGPIFVFSPGVDAPDGKTIEVSIPLASYPQGWGDVALAVETPVGAMVGGEDAEHTRWEYNDANLKNGRAVGDLPGLNGYRLQFVLSNLEAQ